MNWKRILIGVAVVVLTVAAWAAMRSGPLEVEMAVVERRDVDEFISEEGKARLPEAEEVLVDMPVGGTLEAVPVEVGDPVEPGDVVARIEPYAFEQQIEALRARVRQAHAQIQGVDAAKPKDEDIGAVRARVAEVQNALAGAQAEREIARAAHEDAQRDLNRYLRLREAGAVSQSELDSVQVQATAAARTLERAAAVEAGARKAVEQAQLSLQSLIKTVDDNEYLRDVYAQEAASIEAQIGSLERELAKTTVRAPLRGVVLEKHVADRRVLAAGAPLLKLGAARAPEVEIDVLSEEAGRISVGDQVEIYGPALGAPVFGRVTRIYPSAFKKISALGIEQQRVRVIAHIPDDAPALRPGTSVDVRIITALAQDVPAVPERAVFRDNEGWAVMLVKDGRAVLTPVEVGLSNDEWAEIRSPVEPGDTVIVELKNELEPGMRVKRPPQ